MLEVNLATIVAALPVFWPHLRRNIDRIFVTHEVEVKVTSSEGFSEIQGDGDLDTKRRTHWPSDGDISDSKDLSSVILKDLNTTSDYNRGHRSEENLFDVGMPFDGSRSASRTANNQRHVRFNSSNSVSSHKKETWLNNI